MEAAVKAASNAGGNQLKYKTSKVRSKRQLKQAEGKSGGRIRLERSCVNPDFYIW